MPNRADARLGPSAEVGTEPDTGLGIRSYVYVTECPGVTRFGPLGTLLLDIGLCPD